MQMFVLQHDFGPKKERRILKHACGRIFAKFDFASSKIFLNAYFLVLYPT